MSNDSVLRAITRCPLVARARTATNLPCSDIVGVQLGTPWEDHQVPEPWTGDIGQARLLFFSSNPSISTDERYPTTSWSDKHLAEFFNTRFGGGTFDPIIDGIRYPALDGSKKPVKYWSWAKRRAAEILGESCLPGIDYAFTEVVHCKSRGEIGVTRALPECVNRHLKPVLDVTSANVIVAVGLKAMKALTDALGLQWTNRVAGAFPIESGDRYFVHLDHPASGGKVKKFSSALDDSDLARVIRACAR